MISVIVPAYNAEKYLGACIESVRAQTFTDWELLLVDDGSTDLTAAIALDASEKDCRIKYLRRENGGLSAARNSGLDAANGSLIFFLDSDDAIPENALISLLKLKNESEADMACGSVVLWNGDRKMCKATNKTSSKTFSPEEAVSRVLYKKGLDNSVCGKLYAAELWEKVRFREGIGYEDLDLFYIIMLKCKKIASTNECTYLYRQHNDSYVHVFTPRRGDVLDVTRNLTGHMKRHCPHLVKAAESRELSANFNILSLSYRNIKKYPRECKELIRRCKSNIRELRGGCIRDSSVSVKLKAAALLSYILF